MSPAINFIRCIYLFILNEHSRRDTRAGDCTVAGPQQVGEFSFDGAGDGTPRVESESGQFRVLQNGTERYNESIGALEFHHDDTTLAYQGGAVWRTDNNGQAVMVRPPDVHYNFRTLTVPIINITGDVTAERQTGELRLGDTTRLYPKEEDDPNPLRGGNVELEIESERYCTGWEEYFESRAEGSIEETCGDNRNDQIVVEFSVPFVLEEEFENPGVVQNYEGHEEHEEDIEEQGEAYSPEPSETLLEDRREECRERYGEGNMTDAQDEYDEGGLHCVDVIDSTVQIDTEAADEEIELYVENGIELNEDAITDLDDQVTLFLDGGLDVNGNTQLGDEGDPSHLVMFFGAEVDGEEDQEGGGTPQINAVIYAASAEIRFSGNVDFNGVVVAETLDIDGSSADLNFPEEDFEGFELEYETGGAPFYFLHIVETEIEFSN